MAWYGLDGGWNYLLDNHLRLFYDAYYQPAFSDAANYRWQFDLGFDFPIWRGLAFNALYTYTHENVVVTQIQPGDKLLTVGLSYTSANCTVAEKSVFEFPTHPMNWQRFVGVGLLIVGVYVVCRF